MTLGKGKILFDEDFLGRYNDIVWGTGTLVAPLSPVLGFTSVNEGSFASTVDEPGGILAITTDTGDDDNAALFSGPFKPADGTLTFEARFKYSNVDLAIFVGFTQTLDGATPVMPAEFATTTMTYNGTGGMVGFNYDVDGTTDDFRAVMGSGGAAVAGSGNGTRANATLTADAWFEARVVIYPDGAAECWLGHQGDVDSQSHPRLKLVKRFEAGGISATAVYFPTLMVENRSGNARVLEVDYMRGWANRDWAYN